MPARPTPSVDAQPDEQRDWRPAGRDDGIGAIRLGVEEFVKFVRSVLAMELDDAKGAEQDQRLQISLALQAAVLDHGNTADGFAVVNQLVVRKLGKDAEKTEAAFKALVNLVSSKYRQKLSLMCEEAKVPMVVFVKYQGEGKDVQAFFQPWIRVRPPQHGAEPALPDLYIRHPLRTAEAYEAAWRAADIANRVATQARPVETISETRDSGSADVAEELASPRPENEFDRTEAPAARTVAASPQTAYAKLIEFLVQDVIEERSATRRSRWVREVLFGMLGTFGCLVAVFHVVMILLESNGIIARSR